MAAAVGFCAAANAQNKSPLVSNPGNGRNRAPLKASEAALLKKPLYTPSLLDDRAPGFPNKLLTNPFTQQQYDYTKRLHFGFVVSASMLEYRITSSKNPQYNSLGKQFTYFADVTTPSLGMGVAALLDYRINHSFSLRLQAGPTFVTRTVSFYGDDDNSPNRSMDLDNVLVELAFLLKYKAMRHSDVRPYMIAGFTPYCDANSFKAFDSKNPDNNSNALLIATNPFDVALTAGMGVDVYADYFKFSLELKYVMGTTNLISSKRRKEEAYDHFPSVIDKMYSQAFVLSIIFE
ncbi:MAG: PorT family protein [Prevotellaceae bacterium]|jgi:hypothetical protein|nr:PorT family protein [Prevotellaceae bacterium]